MTCIFSRQWLLTVGLLVFGVSESFSRPAAAAFCEPEDQILCESPDVMALERLSRNSSLEDLKDLATVHTAHASAAAAAGGMRMIARAMDRAGHRDAALELLRAGHSGVFRSSNWIENALAKVSIARLQATLGDADATRYLVPGTIVWPERMTGWDRGSVFAVLADGIDDLGDRDRARAVYERGLTEVSTGPFSVPQHYGDRVSGLARLWLSADSRGYRDLADRLRHRIERLIDSPERAEGAWPSSLEELDDRRSQL